MSRHAQRYRRKREREQEEALNAARDLCADEFEPLWRPVPSLRENRGASEQERADLQAAAKQAAFAWLSAQLGIRPVLTTFNQIDDIETLRRSYVLIWNATLADVRRWADAVEAEAA